MNKTINTGNNETLSRGVFKNADGTFTAMTYSQSKTFKTEAGAARWLAAKTAPPPELPSAAHAIKPTHPRNHTMQVKINRPAPKVCTLELTAREAGVLRRLTGGLFFATSGDTAFDALSRALAEGSRGIPSVRLNSEQSIDERTRLVNEFLAADTAEATVDVAVGDEILANGQWRRVEAIVNGSAVYATGSGAGVCLPGGVQDVRKAEPAVNPAAPAMAWPWPAGTKVRFRAGGDCGWLVNGRVYALGDKGGCTPQVLDGDVFVCCVEEHDVERAE